MICCCFYPASVFAVPSLTILELRDTPLTVNSTSEIISVIQDGNIVINTDAIGDSSVAAPINNSSFIGTAISIDTTLSSTGLIASGQTAGAIEFFGDGVSLDSLTINSGIVTSEITSSDDGTINLSNIDSSSPIISVGQAIGNSGTISNTGSGGNAIHLSGSNQIDLTINVNAKGTISSAGNAISLYDVYDLSSLTLNNAGMISAASGYNAISLDGYSATISNSGTITGDIDLGSDASSNVTLNSGGTIAGNITMRDDGQLFIFNGGNLDGTSIDGYSGSGTAAGTIRIDANTTLGGFIGKNNAVSLLEISDGFNFDFNGHNSNVSKISIGAGAILKDNYGDINTDEIDGSSANQGIFNLKFVDVGEAEITTAIGTINGLEQFNITRNITADPTAITVITLDSSIKAETTTINSLGNILRIASGNVVTGNVEIGDGAKFQLTDGSSVSGTIKGTEQYKGTLEFYNSRIDGGLSSVTLNGNVGGDMQDLFRIILDSAAIVDATTNNVAINAQTIRLYNSSKLQLGSGTVTGNILGLAASGSNNGFGAVEFNADNTLGGNVGTSNGNALHNVVLNSGDYEVHAGIYEINATTINLNAGTTLSTAGLISGGDNDDPGGSYKNSSILLNDGASLTLNDGASLYGSINGSGSLTIDTALDSANSHINIGASSQLSSISLLDAASLDLTGNNGVIKADAITLGNNAILKVGNADIVGTVDGDADDHGTLDIQGATTLRGAIGGGSGSLHLLNIGTADADGYSVSAAASISATAITLNGNLTSLSIADDQTVTGDVTIGDGAGLVIGNGVAVNGAINGADQYQGTLTIVNGATFAAGGNIGAGGLDLAAIKIHGTLDLSGLSAYEAHAQTFSLTDGTHLLIGAGVIEGDIKGLGSGDGGVSHGTGLGDVSFAANIGPTNFLVSNIGTNDGHAINELSVGENLVVDTGNADISATRITLNDGASLTSSASTITGGDQIHGGFTRLNTQITLGNGASLTLDNVDTFLGTIDGNDYGQGDLTLTGSYIYNDGNDAIDIGATKKLSSITLTDSTTLDVSLHNGYVKANAITLNDNAILTVGNGDIVGTVDGDADDHGTFNILGNVTLHGAVGAGHNLLALNIGDSDTSVNVTADSIKATTINILGDSTTLTLGDNKSISGNVVLDGGSIITLGNGSVVNGTITNLSDAEPDGQLIIRDNATVATNGDIGGGGFNFAEVALNDGSNLDLSTHNNSISSSLISISDNATLTIGSATVNSIIQAHNSDGGSNYGLGKVVFADNNTLGGYVGADSGATLEKVTINTGKTVIAGDYGINALDIVLNNGAILNSSSLLSAGIAEEGGPLEDARITLNNGAILQLNDGASLTAKVDGDIDNHGQLQILSGTIAAGANIGNSHNLASVSLAGGSGLNLYENNVVLKATSVYLDDGATLTIGDNSVTGNILGHAASGSNNGFGNVLFNGSGNSLAGNVGGHNDNAVANVTINNSLTLQAGSHQINASIITLEERATLITSGAISGGADITGATPIATAITLNTNSLLILNSGSSIFGTIDGSEAEVGTIEVSGNFSTNGDIGSHFKLSSVIVDDGINLDLGTNSNSLNAVTLYLGTDSTLTLGDSGTVSAAITSLSDDTGVVYLNNSVTLDSGSTFGGDTGLLSLYIDHAAAGDVVIDSHDSIKARNVTIEGFRSKLNLSADQIITGNVNLGDGSRLNLADGSSVTGTINSITDSGGALGITSGTVVSQSNIGNTHILGSVTLATGTTFDLATNDNILKSASVTLGSGSNLIIGNGDLVGTFVGATDGDGTITFTKDTNLDEGTFIGDIGTSNHVGEVVINSGVTLTQNETITATTTTINGDLIVAADKGINGDSIALAGTLTLNDGSFLHSALQGNSGVGSLVINDAANFTSSNYLGGDGAAHLGSIVLSYDSTLDLKTNNNSANATNIILYDNSTLDIGTATVTGTIKGSSNGKGNVNFYGNNDLGGNIGVNGNAVQSVAIASSTSGITVDTQGHAIYSVGNITLGSKANLVTSSSISGGNAVATSITMNANSALTLDDGASVLGAINAAGADAAGIGTVDVNGAVTLNGSIGDLFKIKTLTIEDGATLDAATHPSSINAASIAIGTGSTLSIANDSGTDGNFGLRGVINGAGTVSLSASGTNTNYDLSATLGSTSTLAAVDFSLASSYLTVENSIKADAVTILSGGAPSALILAASKNISGDVTLDHNITLNLKNNSSVSGTIKSITDNNGILIVGTNLFSPGGAAATVVAQDDIGDDSHKLALVSLSDNTTLNLATHSVEVKTYDAAIGANSALEIGSGSFSAVNNLTVAANSTITIDDGSLTANAISLSSGSSITTNSGGIYSDVYGGGDVTFADNNSAHGTLGITSTANQQLNSLTLSDGVSLSSDNEIAASSINIGNATLTTSGKISGGFNGTTTLASAITLSNSAVLQLSGNSSVTANINGASSGNGQVDISGEIVGNINIGNSAKISGITIDNDSSLDVSANNNSVNATEIALASSAALTVGTTTLNSAINGDHDDYGTLNIASNKTATTHGDIGNGGSLHAININSGATLNLAANNNSLNATTTTLGNSATLNVGTSAISGTFVGTTSGNGTIIFNDERTLDNSVTLGTADHNLNTITIGNGASVTLSDPFYASHINVGTSGASNSSMIIVSTGSEDIGGDFSLASRGTLNLLNSGFLTIGTIDGKSDGAGILALSNGGDLTLTGDVGSEHYLSAIYVNENYLLNAYSGGASIKANDIYLGIGANIAIGSGTLSATIHGSGNADQISFIGNSSHELSGDLGVEAEDNGIDTIYLQGLLDSGSHTIRANNFILDSTSAVLIFGGGNIDIGTFVNNHAGSGAINFTTNNEINFAIDSSNAIAQLNIADGAIITANQLVFATNTTIGGGTSGKLIVAAAQTIDSNITINNGANLTLNNGSTIIGNILGASSSGSGTLAIAASASITAAGNIGTSDHKLSTITLGASSTLNIGDNNLTASSISLANLATLQIDAGLVNANIIGDSNGHGSVIFTENNSLQQNIGGVSNKVANVTISADQTLTSTHGIYANKVTLENNSTLAMQDGSFTSNEINGSTAGNGNVTAAGTVSFGEIGFTHSIDNLTTAAASNTTFGGNIVADGEININGNAIFSNASTAISASSFNVNSGSALTLAINLDSPATSALEVAGAAIISANTNLNLTISGRAVSGTTITLVNASAASTISTIIDAKINLNNSGANIYHGQTFSTSAAGDQLLLTIHGDFVPDTPPTINFGNNNVQNTYDAITSIANATGALSTIQNYLNNNDVSIAQKEVAIKSTAPQVDNSSNYVAFNNASTMSNIISARLESLYNSTGIVNNGPSFNFNNNSSGKPSFVQTLEPLRDNNLKPSYPLSLALNDQSQTQDKSMWIQTFGNKVNQKNTSKSDGYNSNSGGVSVGFDCAKCFNFILGASASYAQSNVSEKSNNKNLNIDTYQFNIYSGHNTAKYFLNTSVGFAVNNYNSNRQIAIAASTAKADYDGKSFSARAEIGSNYKLKNELVLTPSFMLTAAHNTINSYNESGAGTLNLHVKNNSTDFFEARIGAELSRLFLTKNNTKIRPQFSISYGHDFIGDQQKTTSNFIGQNINFTSDSARVAQGSLKIGTGFAFYTTNDITLSANYGFEKRTNYTSNLGWIRVRYGF